MKFASLNDLYLQQLKDLHSVESQLKRRVRASQHFRSFWGAWRTIAGYETIHMIREGQACCSAEIGLLHRLILGLFAATN